MKIILNADKNVVMEIREEIKNNNGHCPCKLTQLPSTKCMCEEFRDCKIEGYCHCGLYNKVKE